MKTLFTKSFQILLSSLFLALISYQPTQAYNQNNLAVNSVIYEGNFEDNLKSAVISELSKQGANWIGDNFAKNSLIGGVGSSAYWQHKGLHAVLGCATAQANGNDCGSGAFGGVAGEVIAESYFKSNGGDYVEKDKNGNVAYGQDGQPKFDKTSFERDVKALGRLSTLLGSSGLGLDVNASDDSATNAIDNNLIQFALPAILALLGSTQYANAPETDDEVKKGLVEETTCLSPITCQVNQIYKIINGDDSSSSGQVINGRGGKNTFVKSNQDARNFAKKQGWQEIKNPPFNSHGQPVFKKGNKYYTRDVDSHKGGAWKVFDQKGNRKGTLDDKLNNIGK